jgi:PKD repeat protein
MKKLLIPILFLLIALSAMSQNLATVTGIVTDLATGNPIPNQAVTIRNDSATGWYYYQTVYTNNTGYYVDTIPVPLNTGGNLFVSTIDCQNYMHQVVLAYMPSVLNFTADFAICYNSNPCQANFSSQQMAALAVQFFDGSVGGGTTRQWMFGDGATSTQTNPQHTYGMPGYYNVTLSIGALGTTCYQTVTQTIYVWDSTGGGGCQAAFLAISDSMNTTNNYFFIDQSSGNINSWSWDFGDPASGSNNTSTLQNPEHAFSSPGTYNTCLTIHGIDSTCFDMMCLTIVVGPAGGCTAQYTYYADSSNLNNIQFVDQSTSASGYVNYWHWEFGDGQSQSIAYPGNPNVLHTYASPGNYNVCLSILGSDSTCFDNFCQMVFVGTPPDCDAAFTYYTDSLNTGNTYHFIDQSVGNIVSWNWDFGDGNFSLQQNPVHTYAASGTYQVTLTIGSPNQLCFDVAYDTIVVGSGGGCQAFYSYSANPYPDSHTLAFTDLSSGNPTSWQWSFGDGSAGNVQNPVHTYAASGTYTVCLTITGNNCSDTFCQQVIVPDSINYFQIYGQVFAGNFPLSLGMAMIFSLDTTNNYQPFVAVCPIDSNGVYYFTMVPDGVYYILAIPFDSNGYLPTYYGNTIAWQQATPVILGTPNNPYDIYLVAGSPMTYGPGSTSGQINMGGLKTSMVDKVNMILMNEQGTPIGFTHVTSAGVFDFTSMAYGTYYLHPEMPGVTSDNIKVILTPEKPHADVVMTFSGNKIMGINDKVTLANSWLVYPNPVAGDLNITIDMKKGTEAEVNIYNLTGKLVYRTEITLNAGNNPVVLTTSSLPSGIYSMRINSVDGIVLTTKIIKTN